MGNEMNAENRIAVFENKEIRKTFYNGEWWFSVVDVVKALTDSKDVSQYIKKLRARDKQLDAYWGTICTPLELIAKDGFKRKLICANTESIFRIIQSIPSPKAEPFKRWLAKVGYERIQEIENPELAAKRMRGIAVRDELTGEWDKRGVKEEREFSILTAEISKATFGMTPSEYKDFKGLDKENLRDHMTDLELIFTMLGEASTTELARVKDAQGFIENKTAAKLGGEVAGSARKDLENKTGKKITTDENYIEMPEKVKRLKEKK